MEKDVTVLYECPRYCIAVKPAGVLSEDSGDGSMCGLLRKKLGKEYVACLHRLDRDVGGVMIYSLSPEASGKLSAISYEKEYIAVVTGFPEKDEGVMEDLLFHDSRRNKTFVVDRERKGVKKARLYYKVVEKTDGGCTLRITLDTGRTHQIRVQLASRRMPIVGDGKYGGGKGELRLTSVKLSFSDPFTGEYRTFEI